ncbi:unknown [Crocosphaera subtropica ATCC 51142]|uniref:SpoVT-AbrB domain-containing protein n=2 Tax=Crocosphaera TaxID=263510 RepID=B1WXP9_CROS5|nr:unknown [Crocosphaera subtropica ATCC 51142]
MINNDLNNLVIIERKSKDIDKIMADTVDPNPTPLTGKALLQELKQLSDKPRRETAKKCGYYSVTKDGQVRVNLTDFYDAVLAAKGVPLQPGSTKDGRGREPTFRVSVHKNGQIVIGSTYTEQMGLKPGDEFEIKLGYKHIHLKQVGVEDEEAA